MKFCAENQGPQMLKLWWSPDFPWGDQHLWLWLIMHSSSLTLLHLFFLVVVHAQDGCHPCSPSGKRVIQCFRCGEQCKGEVLRVQSNHFHVKCFSCKGEYFEYVWADLNIIRQAQWWTPSASTSRANHWTEFLMCRVNKLVSVLSMLWFNWPQLTCAPR